MFLTKDQTQGTWRDIYQKGPETETCPADSRDVLTLEAIPDM